MLNCYGMPLSRGRIGESLIVCIYPPRIGAGVDFSNALVVKRPARRVNPPSHPLHIFLVVVVVVEACA